MKNALLIHGRTNKENYYNVDLPTESNAHWFPWLSKQLMIKDIHTVAVEMPKPYAPDYEAWKREFERYGVTPDTLLVGHSCGGGFLVRWLSEYPDVRVAKLVLVAPWMGIDAVVQTDKYFFDFKLNPDISRQTKKLVMMASTNDAPEVQASVELLKKELHNISYIELENRGHFTLTGLGSEEFPELLEELLS